MRGRRVVLSILALTFTGGAVEAQAATVYENCDFLCRPVFAAANGETNKLTLAHEAGANGEYARFRDTGAAVLPPAPGYRPPAGAPAVDSSATLRDCTYSLNAAVCRNEYAALVYLGDRNDTATVDAAIVYGGAGNDRLVSEHGEFVGGPGGDTLSGDSVFVYPAEAGVRADMRIDIDGVADDGRAGERDNLRPGIFGVEVRLAGNHTVIGSEGNDSLGLRFSAGSHTIEGRGGSDHIAGSSYGDDRLDGGLGNDDLNGSFGNDVLDAGPGRDLLGGDDGNDTLHANDGEADHRIDCGSGVDTAYVDAFEENILGCENVIVR